MLAYAVAARHIRTQASVLAAWRGCVTSRRRRNAAAAFLHAWAQTTRASAHSRRALRARALAVWQVAVLQARLVDGFREATARRTTANVLSSWAAATMHARSRCMTSTPNSHSTPSCGEPCSSSGQRSSVDSMAQPACAAPIQRALDVPRRRTHQSLILRWVWHQCSCNGAPLRGRRTPPRPIHCTVCDQMCVVAETIWALLPTSLRPRRSLPRPHSAQHARQAPAARRSPHTEQRSTAWQATSAGRAGSTCTLPRAAMTIRPVPAPQLR
jgi:hypothetical protein